MTRKKCYKSIASIRKNTFIFHSNGRFCESVFENGDNKVNNYIDPLQKAWPSYMHCQFIYLASFLSGIEMGKVCVQTVFLSESAVTLSI